MIHAPPLRLNRFSVTLLQVCKQGTPTPGAFFSCPIKALLQKVERMNKTSGKIDMPFEGPLADRACTLCSKTYRSHDRKILDLGVEFQKVCDVCGACAHARARTRTCTHTHDACTQASARTQARGRLIRKPWAFAGWEGLKPVLRSVQGWVESKAYLCETS